MTRFVALLILETVLALSVLACKDTNTEKLEAQIVAQATQIAALQARSENLPSLPEATVLPAVTLPTSRPVTFDRSLTGQVWYVANTGGSGVRLRSGCVDGSVSGGSWPEGAAVTVEYSQSDCPEWLRVQRGEASSWIRVDYLSSSAPTATPVPPTAIPVPPTATRVPPTATSVPQGQLPAPPVIAPPVMASVVESRIYGEFYGWDGETLFLLDNGQVWQQSSYAYTYHYAYRPKVLIYPSGGRWKIQVEGVSSTIYVTRLR